jgi:hypothetical protein
MLDANIEKEELSNTQCSTKYEEVVTKEGKDEG